ncbi:MAG: XdhC family protein [Anaerolineaceae bacterium]|nr:MAG: XdhC family protein [Anaerolineaceae bacterium]
MRIFERLADLERKGETVAIATVIRAQGSVPRHEGSKMLIYPGGGIEGTIGGGELESRVIEEALQVLKDGKPRILHYAFRDPEEGDVGVCGGEMEVFVEALRPSSTLVVVGGGHVGKAVAHLASWLGFRVVVSDDRPEYASSQAVPDADEYIHCELGQLPEKMKIHEETYLVLTTRGVDVDVDGLPKLLDTPAAYIGVIGSRRRWETTAKELIERGVPKEKIARVISPIGLEINAETPEEIAVSILAQIVMLHRGGTGKPMAHQPRGGGRTQEK